MNLAYTYSRPPFQYIKLDPQPVAVGLFLFIEDLHNVPLAAVAAARFGADRIGITTTMGEGKHLKQQLHTRRSELTADSGHFKSPSL
jgi:hypothetical protein